MTYQEIGKIDSFFKKIYSDFNDRNIEAVIEQMTDDVQWANGMDGGFVHGHDGVREYWLRQFTMVSSIVSLEEVRQIKNSIHIRVKQVVHDVEGKLLMDTHVTHVFTLDGEQIRKFEIIL